MNSPSPPANELQSSLVPATRAVGHTSDDDSRDIGSSITTLPIEPSIAQLVDTLDFDPGEWTLELHELQKVNEKTILAPSFWGFAWEQTAKSGRKRVVRGMFSKRRVGSGYLQFPDEGAQQAALLQQPYDETLQRVKHTAFDEEASRVIESCCNLYNALLHSLLYKLSVVREHLNLSYDDGGNPEYTSEFSAPGTQWLRIGDPPTADIVEFRTINSCRVRYRGGTFFVDGVVDGLRSAQSSTRQGNNLPWPTQHRSDVELFHSSQKLATLGLCLKYRGETSDSQRYLESRVSVESVESNPEGIVSRFMGGLDLPTTVSSKDSIHILRMSDAYQKCLDVQGEAGPEELVKLLLFARQLDSRLRSLVDQRAARTSNDPDASETEVRIPPCTDVKINKSIAKLWRIEDEAFYETDSD